MSRGGGGRRAVVIFVAGVGATLPALIFLLLIGDLVLDGWEYLSGRFFVNFASRFPERAGIRAPLLGTLWLLVLTAILAIPVSVGGAIYLEEFAPKNRVTRLIQANIENLAGVPSIVHGVLGLAIFVHALDLGRSVMAGAMTLATLLIPMIVYSAREAIRNVPAGIREAAFSLGSTRWQVVRHQVVPVALPGILSGLMAALSRAAGEAAPLILIGAVTFIAFTPEAPTDPFTALPVQIFHWATRPEDEFRGLAAATCLVLLLGLLGLSGLVALLRMRLASGGARRETGE